MLKLCSRITCSNQTQIKWKGGRENAPLVLFPFFIFKIFILFLFGGGACSLLFVVFVCSGIVLLFDYMRVSNYSTFTTIYAYTKKGLVSATARSRV